ncbi:hypothetical protein EW146_g3017 [Bondarzewia mesenterica]|uniref:F-box domain-containing protein n=1 Tax=Bondarzewia mesenterica TaxID=1095465 RepID=A0A4S4LYY9_9AGAM|nr:hypothetical protein EW146_g3017 [Bondarzewia mesenterica]
MPAVTRRQSGKLPPPRNAAASNNLEVDSEHDDFMDGELTELEESSSDDDFDENVGCETTCEAQENGNVEICVDRSVYEQEQAPEPQETRPAARYAFHASGRSIFRRLTPRDLLQLARTSKALRKVLLSRASVLVWKSARLEFPGMPVPDPPNDVSEPQWANLLLGETACYQCGTKGTQRVDFALHRRVCGNCCKDNLVYSVKFRSKFPDFDPSILDLIPHTNIGGWSHGHSSKSKFYWTSDVEAMAAKVAQFQKDIHMGKTGAQKAWNEFRSKRILHVDAVVNGCKPYKQWLRALACRGALQKEIIEKQRLQEIKARLLATGFDKVDVDSWGFRCLDGVKMNTELTERSWLRIRGKLAEYLVQQKTERIKRERAEFRTTREGMAKRLYANLVLQTLPIQLFYLPKDDVVPKLLCFEGLVDRDTPVSPQESDDWDKALQNLPQCLSDWMCQRRDEFIAMLPPGFNDDRGSMLPVPLSSPIVDQMRRGGMTTFAGRLELAIVVFNGVRFPLFGRDVFRTWPQPQTDVSSFSQRGSQAAASLVTLVGLMPPRTTCWQMDQLDQRFICMNCYAARGNTYARLLAGSWRSCVEHFVNEQGSDHVTPKWRLLAPDETTYVKSRESIDQCEQAKRWQCNHCTIMKLPENRATVVNHLCAQHGIKQPIDNQDLFYFPSPGDRRPPRQHVPLVKGKATATAQASSGQKVLPSKNLMCTHCVHKNRRFDLQGVKQHLQAKHSVVNGVAGTDFSEIL